MQLKSELRAAQDKAAAEAFFSSPPTAQEIMHAARMLARCDIGPCGELLLWGALELKRRAE